MHTKELGERLEDLCTLLLDRGFTHAKATLLVSNPSDYNPAPRLLVEWKVPPAGDYKTEVFHGEVGDFLNAFKNAEAGILNLETPEDMAARSFFQMVSDLKASAEKNGYDVVIPWIDELVNQSRTNILPAPKEAAE